MPRNKDSEDVGQAEVQAIADKETEQGYVGVVPDQTPNENYTLQGQVAGKPTPETERVHPDKQGK